MFYYNKENKGLFFKRMELEGYKDSLLVFLLFVFCVLGYVRMLWDIFGFVFILGLVLCSES